MPFVKGQRPPTKATKPDEPPRSWSEHMEAAEDRIARKVVSLAIKGEPAAVRLAAHTLTPRTRAIRFSLPEINEPADGLKALNAVREAVGTGRLSPDEAASLAELIGAYQKHFELNDILRRLEALEQMVRSRLTNE